MSDPLGMFVPLVRKLSVMGWTTEFDFRQGIFSLPPHLMASQIGTKAIITLVMRVCAETQEQLFKNAFLLRI
jgi:hypothetical protein